MGYLHFGNYQKITQFIAAPPGWFAMMWDGENDYYTCAVAMWALCEIETPGDHPFVIIKAVIGDNDIGGEFNLAGGDDDYFIGYIEPDGDSPSDDEIKVRIEIVRKLMEEKRAGLD